MEALRRPEWWSEDVPFDVTGKTQLEWAVAGAAAYRAAHPERYIMGRTDESVTKSVTSGEKSVTVSVTPPDESVTSKKEKTAARVKRWREKKKGEASE